MIRSQYLHVRIIYLEDVFIPLNDSDIPLMYMYYYIPNILYLVIFILGSLINL